MEHLITRTFGFETLSISGLPMFPTCTFKIIDFAGEVSQKSRFQELLKTVHLHLNLSMINIASIWPLKKPSKTLIILHILVRRPPEELI